MDRSRRKGTVSRPPGRALGEDWKRQPYHEVIINATTHPSTYANAYDDTGTR